MNTTTLMIFLFVSPGAAQSPSPDVGNTNDAFVLERHAYSKPTGTVEHCLFQMDATGKPQPRVLVKKGGIEILWANGSATTTIPRQDDPSANVETHIYPDRHGKVVGIHITKGYKPSSESWASGEYFILDASGNKTLDINPFNDNTRPVPSPSGDYAVGWPEADTPGGPPIFYDATGVRNKWAHGFKGDGWPAAYETWDVHFSPNGKYVAVSAKNGDSGQKALVIVYDSAGTKLFEKDGLGNDVLFSPDSSRLAYYSPISSKFGLVDMKGTDIWETDVQALPRIFSKDGRLLLAMTGQFLTLVDVANGRSIWEWKADAEHLQGQSSPRAPGSWDGFSLRAIAATPDLKRIVLTATTLKDVPVESGKPQRHAVSDKDHLLIFDGSGHLIHWENLPGESIQIPSTLLRISEDGQNIAVSLNDGIASFVVKHK